MPTLMDGSLCLRRVQRNPKQLQISHQTICSWQNINTSPFSFFWQNRSFEVRPVIISRDEPQAGTTVKTGLAVHSKATSFVFSSGTYWLHSWEKQTNRWQMRKSDSLFNLCSCFLPTYSERKTTKNGVTRSLIPWTYPLAGCRMAQINRILSKI